MEAELHLVPGHLYVAWDPENTHTVHIRPASTPDRWLVTIWGREHGPLTAEEVSDLLQADNFQAERWTSWPARATPYW